MADQPHLTCACQLAFAMFTCKAMPTQVQENGRLSFS